MNSERKVIIAVDDNLENLNALKNTLKNIYIDHIAKPIVPKKLYAILKKYLS